MTVKSPLLRTCNHKENADAQSYNKKLEKLVSHMEAELPGSRILYVDTYNHLMDMINSPHRYGKVV